MRVLKLLLAGLAFALCAQAHAQVKLTFWSHWAAEKIKRDYVEDAIKRFEAANPGVKIEAQWYEKTALYAAQWLQNVSLTWAWACAHSANAKPASSNLRTLMFPPS